MADNLEIYELLRITTIVIISRNPLACKPLLDFTLICVIMLMSLARYEFLSRGQLTHSADPILPESTMGTG
jgi:hypothetical protein